MARQGRPTTRAPSSPDEGCEDNQEREGIMMDRICTKPIWFVLAVGAVILAVGLIEDLVEFLYAHIIHYTR